LRDHAGLAVVVVVDLGGGYAWVRVQDPPGVPMLLAKRQGAPRQAGALGAPGVLVVDDPVPAGQGRTVRPGHGRGL